MNEALSDISAAFVKAWVELTSTSATDYHIMLRAYFSYAGVTLTATY